MADWSTGQGSGSRPSFRPQGGGADGDPATTYERTEAT